MEDIAKLLTELMTEEKIALLSGTNFMYSNAVPRLSVSAIRMSDGPHGLRVQTEGGDNGVTGSLPATCFPTAATTANSWDPSLLLQEGEAMGREALHYGINVILGPGANIKRNPLCGRNFEYFSEDPLLVSKLASAEVNGIQSTGVSACVKHFAANNAENYRFLGDSVVDDRALREIYLKVFENIVKQSHPHAVMCAYNKINGEYCCQNKWLLTDLLRNEWGFNGLVMSDWGATHDRVKGVQSGLDIEMPGDTAICRKWIADALSNGEMTEAELNTAVERVLQLVKKHSDETYGQDVDWKTHAELATTIATESAVLLKNDGLLPLSSEEKILVVGDLFDKMRYQGSGSSMINPTSVMSPKQAFDKANINYEFERGYAENELEPNEELIQKALQKTHTYQKIVVFLGLTDYVESEGCDRDSLRLPSNQTALVDALVATGKPVVVVLFGGGVIELPFANKVNGILNMFLPGQHGGEACRRLLFGEANPCGKLAETWVNDYCDVPFGEEYSKTPVEVYKESIFVGYRYYVTAKKQVRFPFGFGLSYTAFDYSRMEVTQNNGKVIVKCLVTNIGNKDGSEVVQIYVSAPQSNIFKPQRELRAFTKVFVKAGETVEAEMQFDVDDLRYFDISRHELVSENGEYIVEVCSDCLHVKLTQTILVNGENNCSVYSDDVLTAYKSASLSKVTNQLFEEMSRRTIPQNKPTKFVTMESRFTELNKTLMGKILFNAVLSVATKQLKRAQKMPSGPERDNQIKGALFLKRILESNSVITMSMSAGKTFPYNFAEGFVRIANGRLISGVAKICSKINAPALPTDKEEK